MYSLILMTAMSSAPQGPEFGGYFRDLFHRNGCAGCYGTCAGRGAACYGTCDGGFGSRIRAFFSFGGCNGCYGSCTGRSYACYGASHSCQGCHGTAHACAGGMAFGSHPAPFDYGGPPPTGPFAPAPTFDPAAPFVPGAVQPIRPGFDGVPLAPNTPAPPAVIEDRNAFRGPPPGPAPSGPNRATVVVKLPADARLYAEGRLLQLTSAERTFVTPELPPGRAYAYTFKVEYDRDGETVSQARKVTVQPGKATAVEFADLVLAKAKEPAKPAPAANTAAATPAPPAAADAGKPNPFRSPAGGERARITVKLPPGATLYIDDAKKEGSEAVREFTTPPLPPGKEFAYLMTVEVPGRHGPEKLIEKVVFRAGEVVTRDFATLLPADRRAGR
jgi:uncharacterized protein (TIGR03000 family)